MNESTEHSTGYTQYPDDYNYDYLAAFNQVDTQNVSFYELHCSMSWDSLEIPGYELCIHILLPIISTIGIVGIILTVLVLSKKTMSTSTNSYLISLAISDLVFLLILSAKCFENKLNRENHYQYIFVMTYIYIILTAFLMASVWLTVMLAIERYIAICHPLRAMGICTVARARGIIVFIYILSLLLRIPDFLKYEVRSFREPCLKKDVMFQDVSVLAQNNTFRLVTSWVDCILLAILPFSLLLFLNICLISEIHRSTNYLRYHMATDANVQTIITGEEIKITMMLISVVVVFFICEAPFVILGILKQLNPDTLFENYNLLSYITILLLVLRSSFNFVLYCWFSEKFWNTFKKTFCSAPCLTTRFPLWLRNQSDQVHSNSNRKISYFNTKETTC